MNKFIFLIILYLVVSCNKEAKYPKNSPYFNTNEVTEIDSSGVTFTANFINRGSDPIIDLGFILIDELVKQQISIKQNGLDVNNWMIRISNDLDGGKTYLCQAYVQTSKNLILGNTVAFTSQGSESPVIESISPSEGSDGTIVVLKGKNFSRTPELNEVYINEDKVSIISANENEIVFAIPPLNYDGDAKVIVRFRPFRSSNTINFKILGPEIISISKLIGSTGDTVVLKGKNLILSGFPPILTLGGYELEIVSYTDNDIYFILPLLSNSLSDFINPVVLQSTWKSTVSKDLITIKKKWETRQPIPADKKGSYTSFSFNHKGYLYGKDSRELLEYDPSLDRWGVKSYFPGVGRTNSAYLADNEYFYIIGGDSLFFPDDPNGPVGLFRTLWAYNLNNQLWKKLNDIPFTFNRATTFHINNKNYMIIDGGVVWKCDFINGIYEKLTERYPKYSFSTNPFKVNDKIFFVESGVTIEFDDIHGSWSFVLGNVFSTAVIGAALNNTGYAIESEFDNYLYKFFPGSNTWKRVSYVPGCSWNGPNQKKEFLVIDDAAYIIVTSSAASECAPLMFRYRE